MLTSARFRSNPEGCQLVAGGRSLRNDHRKRAVMPGTPEGVPETLKYPDMRDRPIDWTDADGG